MKLKLISLGILAAGSMFAMAATSDYKKIKKDLTVMTQIVKSAFKADSNCNRCGLKVSTSYLANQGAVFTIESSAQHRNSHYSYDFGEFNDIDNFDMESLRALEDLPDLLSSIFVTVGESLEEAGHRIDVSRNGDLSISDKKNHREDRHAESEAEKQAERSARKALRDLRSNSRELEFELREHEIELIHLTDDKQRNKITTKMSELSDKIEASHKAEQPYHDSIDKSRETRRDKVRVVKRRVNEQRRLDLVRTQTIVLQAFCDYGSTLKHLPDSERVSVIFKQAGSKQDEIVVLRKSQLKNCETDGKGLKTKALTYMF